MDFAKLQSLLDRSSLFFALCQQYGRSVRGVALGWNHPRPRGHTRRPRELMVNDPGGFHVARKNLEDQWRQMNRKIRDVVYLNCCPSGRAVPHPRLREDRSAASPRHIEPGTVA